VCFLIYKYIKDNKSGKVISQGYVNKIKKLVCNETKNVKSLILKKCDIFLSYPLNFFFISLQFMYDILHVVFLYSLNVISKHFCM